MNAILLLALIYLVSTMFQALCAGYETGFVSANRIRVAYLAEEEHSARAMRLSQYLQAPDKMLTTLLIGTNVGLVVCTIAFSRILAPLEMPQALQELIATLVVTPTMLIFTEIIPKTVFRAHPTRLSLALLPAVTVLYTILRPIGYPIGLVTRGLLAVLGIRQSFMTPYMSSMEDMRVLVDESAANGTIEREEQEMIHSVIDLESRQAKEIMVPRIDIKALSEDAPCTDLVALFSETGRTRIPVYRDSIDEIVGVVNAFDVLLDDHPQGPDIRRFVRPVIHVPDTMSADVALKKMRAEGQHMAIVTDEYGGTDGLITVEDILEEIFGDILDEYDTDEHQIQKVGPHAYVIDARVPLTDAAYEMKVEINEEEVETVGGWVMRMAQRIPAVGEMIQADNFMVTVLEADSTTLSRVRVEILPDNTESTED